MTKKARIITTLLFTMIGFSSYYMWYYRTIKIAGVPVIARMQKKPFTQRVIAILPMGDVKKSDIESLSVLFSELYDISSEILPNVPIPPKTFMELEEQYDANLLNDYLVTQKKHYFRVVGIIDEDMSVSAYGYLFGLASLSREVCTISLTRLRESYYRRPENDLLLRSRIFKIVMHEYGHTFGLAHCISNGSCLMRFIGSVEDLDNSDCGFCWICNQMLRPEIE